jgi:hypothetical protein
LAVTPAGAHGPGIERRLIGLEDFKAIGRASGRLKAEG